MSDLLAIGASGVRAYQTALATTSDNIANAATPGYSRRNVNLGELAAPNQALTQTLNGFGTWAESVNRAADENRAATVRNASADLAQTEAGTSWLQRIDGALTGNALRNRLSSFFSAATALGSDPNSAALRSAMLEAAQGAAKAFAATGASLDAAATDLDSSADGATTKLNSLSTALAKVNSGLGQATPGSANAAALLDQRDQILESMSAITDVNVTLDAAGRASVRSGGAGGPVLVQGDSAATVTYVRGANGAVSYSVHRNGETAALVPSGGALAGFTEAAQRIQDARDTLNTQARTFAEGVNRVQAAGEDQSGQAGQPMFTIGDPPSRLTLALTAPGGIAAAAPGGGPRDNGNLQGFATLRTKNNVEGAVSNLIAGNGAALAARQQVGSAQAAIYDSAVAARDSVSGVNTDEEAVDLMRFQQAYQASSRVIQVARETLQSILDLR